MSPQDLQEETFWNTPGAGARTLHFKGDSLLDEKVDFGASLGGAMDFISPGPVPGPSIIRSGQVSNFDTRIERGPVDSKLSSQRTDGAAPADHDISENEFNDTVLAPSADGDGDATVVLGEASPRELEVPFITRSSNAIENESRSAPSMSPARNEGQGQSSSLGTTPSDATKLAKIKVTAELEHVTVYFSMTFRERVVECWIQARIWTTVGELIMPGHQFDVSSATASHGKPKPPHAKETL